MTRTEYLIRVETAPTGGFAASCRQFAPTANPDVRVILAPAGVGHGRTAPAAMLAAILNARIETVPEPREAQDGS